MSSPLNLGLVVGSFATIGGMVYGSYELLKDYERSMNELLQLRKRIPLNKTSEEDKALWLENWKKYIEAHTKIETEEVKPDEKAGPDAPKPKPIKKEVIDNNDVWGLLRESESKKVNKEEVPEEFKNRCDEEFRKEQTGIWTSKYKNFEKYCTKPDPEND